jgi:hypothetical protein
MVAPYRTPAAVEPSPDSSPCVAPCGCLCARHTVVCLHGPCSRAPAAQGSGRSRARAGREALWARAVTVAGLLLMTGATGSVMALAWKATTAHPAGTAVARAQLVEGAAARPTPQRAEAPRTSGLPSQPGKKRHGHSRGSCDLPSAPASDGATAGLIAGAAPSAALGSLGSPTHVPDVLWARAVRLAAAGLDIILTETSLANRPMDDLMKELGPSTRIVPSAEPPGIQLARLAPGSIARAAGLQEGDFVTAVNGHALGSPDATLDAYTSIRQSRAAVIELRRGGRTVILRLRLRQ